MSAPSWGYSYPVGEWIFPVSIPVEEQGDAVAAFHALLTRATKIVAHDHRLRGASLSWGEYDLEGNELRFHELEELAGLSWDNLEQRLSEALTSPHRVAVSALFLELDTKVASPAGEEVWIDESAELQLSFVAPELHPTDVGVMYSTSIDIWLSPNRGAGGGRRSNPLAELNRPRLEQLLEELAALSSDKVALGQSKLYANELTERGFSR